MSAPLAIDLFCGLGGWTEGFLAEGYDVIGFDVERHVYGEHRYPAQLVLQDVRTLHGSQFRDATMIVASSPCQAYSYMAMPWSRAKQIAAGLRGGGAFPEGYRGARSVNELNELFAQPARIQREASEAAGRYIPMIQENVKGAQPWVGPAQWHYGSFYLWGDVPALMPSVGPRKNSGGSWFTDGNGATVVRNDPRDAGRKNAGGSWFGVAHNTTSGHRKNPDGRKLPDDGVKISGFTGAALVRRVRQDELEVLGPQGRLGPHRENPVSARAIHRPGRARLLPECCMSTSDAPRPALGELARLAQAATPGRWETAVLLAGACDGAITADTVVVTAPDAPGVESGKVRSVALCGFAQSPLVSQSVADAEFIAACSPAVILQLVALAIGGAAGQQQDQTREGKTAKALRVAEQRAAPFINRKNRHSRGKE